MSRYETAVTWVVGRLEGVSPGFRQDLLATVREMTPAASRVRRAVELGSLAALALRLRSRARTAGTRRAQWRQGAYLGGLALALVLAADRWAAAATATQSSAGPLVSAWWIAAVAATGAVGCGLAHCRVGAASWSVLTVAAVQVGQAGAGTWNAPSGLGSSGVGVGSVGSVGSVASGSGSGIGVQVAVVAGYAVVVLALWTGDPGPVRRCRAAVVSVASAPVAGVALVLLLGPDAAGVALQLALSVAGPALLLVAGTFDPRLAVAGTVVWFWRLSASALAELVDALTVLSQTGQGGTLIRWLGMSLGVGLAVVLSRNSIRRLYEL